jgi:hypothetical protein
VLQASGNSLPLSLSGTFLADSALYATPIFHWPLHGASLPLNAKRIRQWSYRLSGGGSLTLASISSALRHSFRYGFARLPYSMHSRELYQESLERTTGLLRTGKSKFKCSMRAIQPRQSLRALSEIALILSTPPIASDDIGIRRWLDCANWALH